ncbi:ComF family protein [Streptomyces sp.]|uniref:ComF family protein n=1 Tax=Streptomyces sp. TaxID=1931 RepID=UPI002D462E6A|nr:ComF family protein [Streptomyces sp.]HZF88469.1 ComF family protein [Streptomyces sp.]
MRGWWQDLTDLVLPAECGGCGRARTVLCPGCRAALSGDAPCRVRPVPEPPGLPVVHAAARYGDEVRAVLLAHKERGALALSGPLGGALAGAARAGLREVWGSGDGASAGRGGSRVSGGPVLLVPVPSGRGAVRARGHDPVRRIALAAAGELRRTGTPARVLCVLRQRRAVADQSGLDSGQRLRNLAGALTVVPGGARLLAGGPVVLVDDLMTTGASLAEAARVVRQARAATSGGPDRHECPRDVALGRWDVAFGEEGVSPVYGRGSRERTGTRTAGAKGGSADRERVDPGMAEPNGAGDVIRAAVIAATPDSFEINRN